MGVERRLVLKEAVLVAVVTVVCLAPFAGKAFHIDDTLFLLCARQIQDHPCDFYGFEANWYGYSMPMHQINQNPPLVPYYIAAAGWLFGWSEVALHLAFLVPAVGLSLGMYFLARFFCSRPLIAALAGVLSPTFLVSSSCVMTDVTMVAFYVWAVVLWLRGFKDNRFGLLLCSSILVCLSMMAKYYGATAIGLLFVYSLVEKRRIGIWILFLLAPVAALAGYELLCYKLYGSGLVGNAVSYASQQNAATLLSFARKPLVGLSFTGGCAIGVLFYGHLLWGWRKLIISGVIVLIAGVVLSIPVIGAMSFDLSIQFALLMVVGIGVLSLAGFDVWRHRDALSVLLLFWVLGTFVFSTFVNWTINARTILPMAPVVGILIVRKLEERHLAGKSFSVAANVIALSMAGIFSLSVVWADTTYANCQRSAAKAISERYDKYDKTVWFEGHWGFQYYMELYGIKALDYKRSTVERGDIVVLPLSNCEIKPPPKGYFELIEDMRIRSCRWLTTLSTDLAAGFYSNNTGQLPFSFGKVPEERYLILLMTESMSLSESDASDAN